MDMTNAFVMAMFMILFLFVAAVTGFGQIIFLMIVVFIVFVAVTMKGSQI